MVAALGEEGEVAIRDPIAIEKMSVIEQMSASQLHLPRLPFWPPEVRSVDQEAEQEAEASV